MPMAMARAAVRGDIIDMVVIMTPLIRHKETGRVLFRSAFGSRTMRQCVEEAVRGRKSLENASLRDVDLSEVNLQGAKLNGADLTGADFTGADLKNASLEEAVLAEANFFKADMIGTRLAGAILTWADLTEADLTDAYLEVNKENLRNATFTEARVPASYKKIINKAHYVNLERVRWV